jgi:hypothetical protein
MFSGEPIKTTFGEKPFTRFFQKLLKGFHINFVKSLQRSSRKPL